MNKMMKNLYRIVAIIGAILTMTSAEGGQENPFTSEIRIEPSKCMLSPGESFYLTVWWYRTCYCPSDYFKILYKNESIGEITEAGRHAEPYWTMCGSNCWETDTQNLQAPTEYGTYTVKAVHCSGHGEEWCGYYNVNWNCPRSDGGFIGYTPDELSWDFYEIAATSKISVGCATALSVPLGKQCDSPWGTDTYDRTASNICNEGCALTSAVMVLRYYGVATGIDGKEVNPRNLNEWLKSQSDGYDGGSINWWAVTRYSKVTMYSKDRVIFNGRLNRRDDKTLNNDLCEGKPVILKVPTKKGHFVVATGTMCVDNEITWSINDPAYDITTLQGYDNKYLGLRRFKPN
ncbi:MAG: C39 family peptidase [Thermodesulfovibrionales bacterium]|nr:C39 family peptidase [Thermodesulfovibrionales bacterium]